MMSECAAENTEEKLIGKIPVRNIWLLFLYASDLASFHGRFDADVEKSSDIATLIARLLVYSVEHRLRRNLSKGYRQKDEILRRVRGKIDVLKTYSRSLLEIGEIACKYEDQTIDTPRNRYVLSALEAIATKIKDGEVIHRCKSLANMMSSMGVGRLRPSRGELATDQISRNEIEDRFMVTLAHFVFDLVLPTEDDGEYSLVKVSKEEKLVRTLFERAIRNFYKIELDTTEYDVAPGNKRWDWMTDKPTEKILTMLPTMQTDIVIENRSNNKRLVIDTKFTSIFAATRFREEILKSGYIYQMYAYLRSQEKPNDVVAKNAEGMLLHPCIGEPVDESAYFNGHLIRFTTVDLAGSTEGVMKRLRSLVKDNNV